eukprot:m.95420 g.95420  ORF g.95420 m.95420 type:complete len:94 (+) comp16593_c0_seq1:195-476(+)
MDDEEHSELDRRILHELYKIANTTEAINAEFMKLIESTSAGGDFWRSQKEAADAMRMWNVVMGKDSETTSTPMDSTSAMPDASHEPVQDVDME